MPFSALDITPAKRRGRPKLLNTIEVHKLYEGKRPVTAAKKNDMQDLLPYIPSVAHDFFNTLETAQDAEDVGPLAAVDEEGGFDEGADDE